jgi:hypothetical protein
MVLGKNYYSTIILCMSYFQNSLAQSRVKQKVSVNSSKLVDYPLNYQHPCQIKAKEALSALNR